MSARLIAAVGRLPSRPHQPYAETLTNLTDSIGRIVEHLRKQPEATKSAEAQAILQRAREFLFWVSSAPGDIGPAKIWDATNLHEDLLRVFSRTVRFPDDDEGRDMHGLVVEGYRMGLAIRERLFQDGFDGARR